MREVEVYYGTCEWLLQNGWHIICSNPPGGSSSEYGRCILPHQGVKRGRRDEVDVMCIRGSDLLLFECKPSFNDSLRPNRYGESDIDKLRRIRDSYGYQGLRDLIKKVHRVDIPEEGELQLWIAVSKFDLTPPNDIHVLDVSN